MNMKVNHLKAWLGWGWLMVAAAGTSCSPEPAAVKAESLAPASVKVQAVALKQQAVTEEAVGTVRPKLKAAVSAKISGRIESLPVVVGQAVKIGDLLAELDVREIKARLDQALAMREQAESDLKRLTKLLQQEVVSKSEFDAVKSRQQVAEATVREAETMLGYARVGAPFTGVVVRKWLDVGDLATPGRPLVELEDPVSLRFEADVPETLIGRVTPGGTNLIYFAASAEGLAGVVSELSPTVDPNSRTILVKFDLPAQAGVRSGQFGRVRIVVSEGMGLRVPAAAVVQRGQMELVFVEANRQAQLRLVKTGKRVGSEVELLSGVSAGERVVTEGAAGLVDGQPLQVQP